MQQNQPRKLSVIWKNAKTYFSIRLDYLRLNAIEKTAKIIGDLLSGFLLIFFISIILIISTITIAFYLSELLRSYTLGFGCVTLVFVAGSFLLFRAKEKLEYLIGNLSIKRYFERHCDKKEESE